jgi:hypothetical protein
MNITIFVAVVIINTRVMYLMLTHNEIQSQDTKLHLGLIFCRIFRMNRNSKIVRKLRHFKSMLVFWVVMPCSLVSRYQRFGRTYCPHLQNFSFRAQGSWPQTCPGLIVGDLFGKASTEVYFASKDEVLDVFIIAYCAVKPDTHRWDFRFSRRRVWRWLSSGMLRSEFW